MIGWLRANLFPNWWNAILTVLCLAAIWYVLSGLLGWTLRSVWTAGSLSECREIMIASWGSTHGHACWGVINDRWLQLLFGFYPPGLYYRPILAFLLLIAALAPVLFADKVSPRLLAVTAAYPFLMPWADVGRIHLDADRRRRGLRGGLSRRSRPSRDGAGARPWHPCCHHVVDALVRISRPVGGARCRAGRRPCRDFAGYRPVLAGDR